MRYVDFLVFAGVYSTAWAFPAAGSSINLRSATSETPVKRIVRSKLPQRGYQRPGKRLQARGVVPLTDNAPGGYDEEYLINLSVGTPAQNFSCLFDTGSDILYLPYQCTTQDCLDHSEYLPSQSSTSKVIGQNVQITYGTGSASGVSYQDVVTVANYTVTTQQFVAANDIQDGQEQVAYNGRVSLPTDPSDCLIGISYQTIPATGTLTAPNFVQNLVSEGVLSSFGMYLVRAEDISGATSSGNATTNFISGSEICLGCTDTAKYTGSFATIPLSIPQTGYWAGTIDGFVVNGQLVSGTSGTYLFDSGTNLAGLPTTTLAIVAKALGGTQSSVVGEAFGGTGYSIACNAKPTATIGVQIAGKVFDFSSEDLIEPVTGNTCGLAFFGSDDEESSGLAGILGQTFLKNVYTQFSYSNGGSIGVASLSSNASSSASTVTSTRSAATGLVPTSVLALLGLMAFALIR